MKDACTLGALEPASLLTLRVCTHFLQSGLLHGLTLSELGALMTAGDEEDSISALQSLVNEDVACLARFLTSGSPRSVFDVHNTSSQFSMGQFGSGLGVALEHIMASKSEGLLVLKIKESIDALFAHKISRSLKRIV